MSANNECTSTKAVSPIPQETASVCFFFSSDASGIRATHQGDKTETMQHDDAGSLFVCVFLSCTMYVSRGYVCMCVRGNFPHGKKTHAQFFFCASFRQKKNPKHSQIKSGQCIWFFHRTHLPPSCCWCCRRNDPE